MLCLLDKVMLMANKSSSSCRSSQILGKGLPLRLTKITRRRFLIYPIIY